MIPVLTMALRSGGTASTQPESVRTCRPAAVARGKAVMRLMSPCWAAHTYCAPGAVSIDG